jgi:regulatory protein
MEDRKNAGPRRLDSDALWEYAVRSLAGRAHSTGELREKLRRRALRAADIDGILARLKDHGYLDRPKGLRRRR